MTNEEKIKEIVKNQPFAFFNDNYQAMIAWGADKMTEWKDHQFKEYLEKKKEENIEKMKKHILYSESEEYYHNRVMFCQEIINELFGEL